MCGERRRKVSRDVPRPFVKINAVSEGRGESRITSGVRETHRQRITVASEKNNVEKYRKTESANLKKAAGKKKDSASSVVDPF